LDKKPKDLHQYQEWLNEIHGAQIDERYETYYESVASKVMSDLKASKFWITLVHNLDEYGEDYLLRFSYPLLMPHVEPELVTKPYESFLLKTYRKNILENSLWPTEPKGGWFLPDNWFSRINDVVRTLLVVKYLDGVNFLKEKIESFCKQQEKGCKASFEAREEGYYAAHLYIQQSFEIPKINWDTETVDFSIEIQITTQLQEVIRKLLHKYYEERRKKQIVTKEKWQWDYRSTEFSTNYLGHILHYVEGMIMEIREKQREGSE
jgi:hypothetical protein